MLFAKKVRTSQELQDLVELRLSRYDVATRQLVSFVEADETRISPTSYDVVGHWPENCLTDLFAFEATDSSLVNELVALSENQNYPFQFNLAKSDRGILQPRRNIWYRDPSTLYVRNKLRLRVFGKDIKLTLSSDEEITLNRKEVASLSCDKVAFAPIRRLKLITKDSRNVHITWRIRFSFYRDVWAQQDCWCDNITSAIMRELWSA